MTNLENEKNYAIKPGPKPKKEDGSDDRRRRVDPPNQPKHPGLKPHIPNHPHHPGQPDKLKGR